MAVELFNCQMTAHKITSISIKVVLKDRSIKICHQSILNMTNLAGTILSEDISIKTQSNSHTINQNDLSNLLFIQFSIKITKVHYLYELGSMFSAAIRMSVGSMLSKDRGSYIWEK